MKKLILLALLLPLFATSQIITADSSSINFGVVLVGETDSALVTLTNAEPGTLNVTNIKFYSIYGEVPFSAAQTVFTIPGNGSTSVWIYFSPIQNILHNSTMVVQHSASSGHEAISLGGQGRFQRSYYDSTENVNEETLKNILKRRLGRGYTQLSYAVARDNMYASIDNNNGIVECAYSGRTATFNTRSGANSNSFNCEHTFPQGMFNQALPMRSDIHHLFSTDVTANSRRGNNPFGLVSNPFHYNVGGSRSDNVNFEPRNVQKGKTARAMMYFVIRYQDYSNHFSVQQNILKTWHNTYLVDSVEQRRNDDIFTTQGNRNPFVDYPQLEKRITNFVANSVAPSVNGLDVLQTSINFGTFFAQTSDTFDYVLVNTGNQVINFTNFALSNTANLSFAAGSGTNTALNPGEAIEISVVATTSNSTTINESLSFSTNLTFPRNNFTIPISGQSVVVGLNDQELNNTIQVYPNPIQDHIYIRNEGGQEIDIRLLDVAGKALDVEFLNQNGSYYLPAKEIASGLYFLEISTEVQRIVKKVVK